MLVVALLSQGGWAAPASARSLPVNLNFQPAGTPPPSGYLVDSGQGFDAARGYGWVGFHDELPVDLTANTRYGWDAVTGYTTLLQMQQRVTGGVTGGRWEYAVADGTYAVTVTAGDARKRNDGSYCCLDSVHRLTVENVLAVDDFVPSVVQPLVTATVIVAVADGRLTIDPLGGDNTKIDRVSIASSTGTPQPATPEVVGVTPARSATGVALNTAVSLAVNLPIDPTSLGSASMRVSGPDGVVSGGYNSDAAGGTASFTPSKNLNSAAVYTVSVTSSLRSADGVAFAPFTSTFTTGTSTPAAGLHCLPQGRVHAVPKPDVLALGPDGKLYVGTAVRAHLPLRTSSRRRALGSGVDHALRHPRDHRPGLRPVEPNDAVGHQRLPVLHERSSHVGTHLTADNPNGAGILGCDGCRRHRRSAALGARPHDQRTRVRSDGTLYIAQGADTGVRRARPLLGCRGETPARARRSSSPTCTTRRSSRGGVVDMNTDPVDTVEDVGSTLPWATTQRP